MGMSFLATDIEDLPPIGIFDHACANPPYHHATGTASPLPARDTAKRAPPGLVAHWATILGAMLRPGGTLTIIASAARLPEALGGFESTGCAPAILLPLWPKAGRAAKLMLLQGIKGARSQFQVLPGLALHAPDGKYTRETDAVLRNGGGLTLGLRG
jgi:tRNA1(Val) A37 N6-methylase TrmN6